VKPLRLAIIGFGKLGKACAQAIQMDDQADFVDIVRHNHEPPLPPPFNDIPTERILADWRR